jgi:hypothetical protein
MDLTIRLWFDLDTFTWTMMGFCCFMDYRRVFDDGCDDFQSGWWKGARFLQRAKVHSQATKFRSRADGQIDDATTPGLHLDLIRSTVLDRS